MSAVPAEIGEYRLLRLLGRGGMGEVYLAEDRALDRLVAIKLIAGMRDHPDAHARFALEAKAIARLKHANVVTVYRTGELDGRPYLVSEFVEGTSLDQLARPLPRTQAIAVALGLARGLAAAHAQGVLHRDVKLANAILGDDGTVKLLDFGLAKLGGHAEPTATPGPARAASAPTPVDDAPPINQASTITFDGAVPVLPGAAIPLTLAGARLGTPRYMSPEAWRGEPLTAASDVYSLGVVLWELLAGRHPLDGDRELAGARLEADEPPSIAAAVPELAPALVAVIDRCVRRAAEARYADAGALLADLELALAPRRSRRAWWIAGATTLAVGGGLVAFAASRPDDPPARSPAAPRALTHLGGCAASPAFLDAATIAFDFSKDDVSDVMTTTGDGVVTPLVAHDGVDYSPATGRHLGEALYIHDTDDASELRAFDRATRTHRTLARGTSAAAAGDTIYLVPDDDSGVIHALDQDGVARPFATLPPGKSPYALGAARSAPRLAVVVADPESPAGLCVVELATRAVRCPDTQRLLNGRPAVTNDGRFVYYASTTGVRRLDLAGDTGDRLIAPGVRASSGLALSPDQTRLVASDCRTYGSIVAVGDGKTEILVEQGLAKHPAAGPAGELAWIDARDGGGTALRLRAPSAAPRVLAASASELGRPAFDPSGARVAYVDAAPGGGLRSVPVTGGSATTWTDDPRDRAPVWTRDGGLAVTRLEDGGAPTVVYLSAPGAAPRVLATGWTVEDLDPASGRLLVSNARALAHLDLATAQLSPLPLGGIPSPVLAARVAPGGAWIAVLSGSIGATFYKLDRAGVATVLHRVPDSQTTGDPTILADGRIAFRPEIWLGELYELDGAWSAP